MTKGMGVRNPRHSVNLGIIFPRLYWRHNGFVALVLTKPIKEIVL